MARAFSYLRLSSDVQLRGDGLRRQLQASRDYATEHGLDLVESDQMADIGISAFKGMNVATGALGGFIAAVTDKRVDPGSFLLIESLDRLSRQAVMKSLGLFTHLLNNDIRIVTLADRKVYSADSDFGDLIMSIVSMQRSHEESALKSTRVGAAWARKRARIDKQILTRQCPAWLKPKADGSGFEIVKSRAAVVARIFSDTTDRGMGVDSIARQFNKEKIPTFGSGRGWHKSYVFKILRSKAVIGEFEPRAKGKSTNQAKLDYFPRVVSPETFHRAAAAIESRRQAGGGRKGELITNVFTKLIFCGPCGHRMNMKGGRRGGRVLYCDGAHRGLGCTAISWRYEQFEESALRFLHELDLQSLAESGAPQSAQRQVEGEIGATEGRLIEAKRRRDRGFELLLGDEPPTEFMKGRLRELEIEVTELEQKLAKQREKLNAIAHESEAYARSKSEITEMVGRVQSGAADTLALRTALSARLKELIKRIFIWSGPVQITVGVAGKVEIVYVDRCFSVIFRNGTSRLIAPATTNPGRVVNTGAGRVVAGDATVREELVRRIEAEPAEWEDFALIEPAG